MIPRILLKSISSSTLSNATKLSPLSSSITSSITSSTSIHNRRALSSTASDSGFFSKLTGSSKDSSSAAPPSDDYGKQIYNMSRCESWTLNDFSNQMKAMSGGWKAKLPFLSGTDQVKQMKKMQALVDATMEVVGTDADASQLKEIGKKEKLMICLKCESDLQEVNSLITQFQSMDIMHRVLKYRKENNLSIPTTEEGTKNAMQSDMRKVLTTREFKSMQRQRMKNMK